MTATTLQNAGRLAAFQHKHGPKQLCKSKPATFASISDVRHKLDTHWIHWKDVCTESQPRVRPRKQPEVDESLTWHTRYESTQWREAAVPVGNISQTLLLLSPPFRLKHVTKNTYEALCIFELHLQALFYRGRKTPIRNMLSAEWAIYLKKSPQGYTRYRIHTRRLPTYTDLKPQWASINRVWDKRYKLAY